MNSLMILWTSLVIFVAVTMISKDYWNVSIVNMRTVIPIVIRDLIQTSRLLDIGIA